MPGLLPELHGLTELSSPALAVKILTSFDNDALPSTPLEAKKEAAIV